MTTFRGIEVVAAPPNHGFVKGCSGCIVLTQDGPPHPICESLALCDEKTIVQPDSLHDGRPRVVLTGGRKPSFRIKAVWFRNGRLAQATEDFSWGQIGFRSDILAVERADEGEE